MCFTLVCSSSSVSRPLTATRLAHAGLDPSRPTLFLSECVLTYVRPEDVAALLRWCAAEFRDSIFLNYEQIGARTNAECFALTAEEPGAFS